MLAAVVIEKNLEEAVRINFASIVRMARLCKERNIPFVTYSTAFVFDGEKGTPYTEEDVVHPLQMYSISKLAGEYGALAAYPEGSIIIRTGALYGGGNMGSGGDRSERLAWKQKDGRKQWCVPSGP